MSISEKPTVPEPTVDSIARSGTAYEIFSRLCSGWSPYRISRELARKGIQITPRDIKEYMEEIPPAYFLPPSRIRTRLLQLDVQIDALGGLARLIRIQEERVSTALLVEEVNPMLLSP